jgi:hypothetical protein
LIVHLINERKTDFFAFDLRIVTMQEEEQGNPTVEEEDDWEIDELDEIVEIINQRLDSLKPFMKCTKIKVRNFSDSALLNFFF